MAAFGSGLGCYDWKTMAACTGGDYQDGWLYVDTQGANLPGAYGAAWDGSCAIGLGDPGLVFTVDPAGRAPCTSLGAGTEPRTIDLRDQRCDGTIGTAAWQQIALADTAAGELASVTVIVRDDATGAVLASKDITNGALDLSGVDPQAHPAVRIEATAVSTAGDPAWSDAVPPRVRVAWKADPKQLCFDTATEVDCASPLTPVGVATHLDSSAVKDEETLELLRAACPPKLGALPDRSVAEQTLLAFDITASDPNGGPLKYSLMKAPPGMAIDPATGHLSWTPTEHVHGQGHRGQPPTGAVPAPRRHGRHRQGVRGPGRRKRSGPAGEPARVLARQPAGGGEHRPREWRHRVAGGAGRRACAAGPGHR
jgi:hypothetical protein